MASAAPDVVRRPAPLTVFAGKGGVGKTTCAAATALARVRRGEDVLLLSVDPAHSLRDSLGAEAPEGLAVEELDADAALASFRQEHRATLHEIVSRGTLFDDADVQRLLDLALPGMDEVMAVLRLADALGEADRPVVLDTAPTGHALRLVDTPDQFDRWLGFLDTLLEKHRTMRAAFAGRTGPDALDAFVRDMQARVDRVRTALRSPDRCRFVAVTRPEPVVLAETAYLIDELRRREIDVAEGVVNAGAKAGRREIADPARQALTGAREGLRDVRWWVVPAYDREGRDAAALERVWADAEPLDLDALQAPGEANDQAPGEANDQAPGEANDQAPGEAGDAPSGHAGEAARGGPPVRQAAPLPDVPLALVAGKGGVGKTTVAAATALRRGEALQQSSEATGRVLCASTDPAHSLATALDRPVGDEPTPVAPGVDAVEIDATARFEALRRRYVDDVRQFFARTGGPNVDFSADRRVAEGLMNLAPPGIDEVMGWIAVMEFLDGDRYHACVLDTAPTGHFARFLELPAVFEEWIRTLFRILQSYEKVIRVPDLVDRLVRLSRSIKRLRTRLASADESAVVAVTLPESMVWAETEDLVACAEQNGVPLPLVVLNRARPSAGERVPGDGGTADSARLEEKAFLKGRDLAIVEEGVPPRGVAALAALGQRLYQPVPVGQDAA